jgi:hypothetical protein
LSIVILLARGRLLCCVAVDVAGGCAFQQNSMLSKLTLR